MTIDIEELRAAVEAAGLNAISTQEVIELLDRLEAAEKSDAESIAMYRKARDERDTLRAELSKQQALTDAAQHIAEVAQSRANQLRAKVEAMERLITWVKDECRLYPDSLDEKAFANRLLAAITHPKSGLHGAQGEKK